MVRKRRHKLHFDLMENTKENTVYGSPLSNTGCYKRVGPSPPSLGCFFTEAACSSGPGSGPSPSPQGPTSLTWEVVSPQDIPSPCANRTTSQQRGLVNRGSRISSRAGSRLEGGFPLLPDQKHPKSSRRSHHHQSWRWISLLAFPSSHPYMWTYSQADEKGTGISAVRQIIFLNVYIFLKIHVYIPAYKWIHEQHSGIPAV